MQENLTLETPWEQMSLSPESMTSSHSPSSASRPRLASFTANTSRSHGLNFAWPRIPPQIAAMFMRQHG